MMPLLFNSTTSLSTLVGEFKIAFKCPVVTRGGILAL
jgi:hypothetical protein